jgi:uncharacterized protein with HEPN domain
MQINSDVRIFLTDMKQSIDEIFAFLPGKRDFIEFCKDLKTRKAVERIQKTGSYTDTTVCRKTSYG